MVAASGTRDTMHVRVLLLLEVQRTFTIQSQHTLKTCSLNSSLLFLHSAFRKVYRKLAFRQRFNEDFFHVVHCSATFFFLLKFTPLFRSILVFLLDVSDNNLM